jgi:hypothetical protein
MKLVAANCTNSAPVPVLWRIRVVVSAFRRRGSVVVVVVVVVAAAILFAGSSREVRVGV